MSHGEDEDKDYALPDHWLLARQPETIWTIEHEVYVSRAVELIIQSGATNVIEVGCGDGWNCSKLVKAGLQVVGIDRSQNAIDYASRLVPDAKFFCGDVTDPAFLERFSEPFAAMVLIEVIEHIPPTETVDALRRMRRSVKTGGVLVVTTPSVNMVNDNPQHYRHFSPELLTQELESSGFHVEDLEGYGHAPSARQFLRIARWVDNRYYTVHPLRRRLLAAYRGRSRRAPPDQGRGLIALARAA